MDYSGLVRAYKEGDQRRVSRYCNKLTPILCNFLMGRMGASREDADDAIQNMYEYLFSKIEKDEITNPEGLLGYIQTASRHSYLNLLRARKNDDLMYYSVDPSIPADQVWNLIQQENKKVISNCISKMEGHYRPLVLFMFEYNKATPADIAEYFDISINNAWTRKYRVVNMLSDCVKKYK